MVDDNEDVLRKSLAAVDRHRTWLLVGTALGVVLLVLAFGTGARAIHADSHDSVHGVLNFLHAVMLILGIWSGLLALMVVMQVTAMTKKILRAIELASRK